MCNNYFTPKLLTLQVGYLFLKLTCIFLSKAFFQSSFSILQQLLFRNTCKTIFLVHSILVFWVFCTKICLIQTQMSESNIFLTGSSNQLSNYDTWIFRIWFFSTQPNDKLGHGNKNCRWVYVSAKQLLWSIS